MILRDVKREEKCCFYKRSLNTKKKSKEITDRVFKNELNEYPILYLRAFKRRQLDNEVTALAL